MSDDAFWERRKQLLREALIRAARALLDHMRTLQAPPAALSMPLGNDQVAAIGAPASIAGLMRSDAAAEAPAVMTEARAREILHHADGSDSHKTDDWFVQYRADKAVIGYDNYLSADELEAIAWWLRNKPQMG